MDTMVTRQGTVVIPPEVIQELGLKPGSAVELQRQNGSVVLREKRREREGGNFEDLFGILKSKVSKSLTLEEMEEGVAKNFAKHWGHEYQEGEEES